MKKITVSVIIINYKNSDQTVSFVREELSKLTSSFNLVVVDNEATLQNSKLLAEKLSADCICDISNPFNSNSVVINSSSNLGFARGNNLGARLACFLHSDYLLFANNDIKIEDANIIDVLTEKMESDSRIGIIGPKVVGLKGEYQSPECFQSFWDRYVWMELSTLFLSKEKKKKRFNFDYSENAKEGFHYKLMGSFFMVRASDFFNCGMMDPHTFLYSEETILTERMNKLGLKPYYLPTVSVIHAHGQTTSKYLSTIKKRKIQFESEYYYYDHYIHTPKWQLILGRLFQSVVRFLK